MANSFEFLPKCHLIDLYPIFKMVAFPVTPGFVSPYSALFPPTTPVILYNLFLAFTILCPLSSLEWNLQEGSDIVSSFIDIRNSCYIYKNSFVVK